MHIASEGSCVAKGSERRGYQQIAEPHDTVRLLSGLQLMPMIRNGRTTFERKMMNSVGMFFFVDEDAVDPYALSLEGSKRHSKGARIPAAETALYANSDHFAFGMPSLDVRSAIMAAGCKRLSCSANKIHVVCGFSR